jgi:hypothetical protein
MRGPGQICVADAFDRSESVSRVLGVAVDMKRVLEGTK